MSVHFDVIGMGKVGREVIKQATAEGWEPRYFIDSENIYGPDMSYVDDTANLARRNLEPSNRPNLAFLVIPSDGVGEVARSYLTTYAGRHIPIVTCEKSGIANFGEYWKNNVIGPYVGNAATVGGGAKLLDKLSSIRPQDTVHTLHLVLNGTLNFILDKAPRSYEDLLAVVTEARGLGYCEPSRGDQSIVKGLDREVEDVLAKTSIVLNTIGLFRKPFSGKAQVEKCNLGTIMQMIRHYDTVRYVVTISRNPQEASGRHGGFRIEQDGWTVTAGFINVDPENNPAMSKIALGGVDNGFLAVPTDGSPSVLHSGPGAGPAVTAAAMIDDAKNLLSIFRK